MLGCQQRKTIANSGFFVFFVVVVCLVLFSLVSAAFLANKDVYNRQVAVILSENLKRSGAFGQTILYFLCQNVKTID